MIKSSSNLHAKSIALIIIFGFLCWHNLDTYSLWAASGAKQHKKVILTDGWYKTKWGMSPEEVSSALGQKIVLLDHDIISYDIAYSHIIENYRIVRLDFTICFSFDPAKGLCDVLIKKKSDAKNYADLNSWLTDLEDGLKKKYGAPSEISNTKEKPTGNVMVTSSSREWLTPSTFIKLRSLQFIGGPDPGGYVYLRYISRSADGDNL